MWKIITFVLMALIMIGNFIRLLLIPAHAAKKGRRVDVRVLSCEEKISIDRETRETTDYYELTVDFYDLKSEVLVKTLPSGRPYMSGEVIRCRYVDKTGLLMPEASPELQARVKQAALVFGIVFVIFMGIVAAMLWGMNDREELPSEAAIGFGYFISIAFLAISALGIYKNIKRAQNKHNLRSISGVQVGYTTGSSTDSDGVESELYYPVYEYEWGGERRQLSGSIGTDRKESRSIGRKVHILLNPQTGEVTCKEDERPANLVFLITGIVGLATLVLMLALSFGILPKNGGGQKESNQGSAQMNTEELMLELYCTYEDMEREICCYSVHIYKDGSGRLLLFPIKTVSGRGIDQEIRFTISEEDLENVIRWVQRTDVESLKPGAHRADETDVYVSLQIYEDGERYHGGGYCDEGIYADIYELIQKTVPVEAWEEMEKRETAYYQ